MEAGARGGAYCAAAPPLTLDPLLLPLAEDAPPLCCTVIMWSTSSAKFWALWVWGCSAVCEERMWGLPSLNWALTARPPDTVWHGIHALGVLGHFLMHLQQHVASAISSKLLSCIYKNLFSRTCFTTNIYWWNAIKHTIYLILVLISLPVADYPYQL